jgi:hypothetical protein
VDTGFPQKMRQNKESRARFRFNLIGTRSSRARHEDFNAVHRGQCEIVQVREPEAEESNRAQSACTATDEISNGRRTGQLIQFEIQADAEKSVVNQEEMAA